MHGNEPAGVLAIEEVFRMLDREPQHNPGFAFRGRIIGVRGNLQAIYSNKRFLEKDLNRQFTPENITRVKNTIPDKLEAEDRELREIVDLVNDEVANYNPKRLVVLDLHTTTADGGIFSIATDDEESIRLAKAMHAPVITGLLSGLRGTTLHYFCCDQFSCPTVSMTFEAGQHDDPKSAQRAVAAIINLLGAIGSVRPEDVENRHGQLLINYSKGLPAVARLITVHRLRADDDFEMLPGYRNFQYLKAGEVLAKDRHGVITAPRDCLILMPHYQPQGEDGFFLIEEIEE